MGCLTSTTWHMPQEWRRIMTCKTIAASFKVAFIDELYRATAQDIADNQLELEEA